MIILGGLVCNHIIVWYVIWCALFEYYKKRRQKQMKWKVHTLLTPNPDKSFYHIFHFPLIILQCFNIQKTILNTDPLFPYLNFDKPDN